MNADDGTSITRQLTLNRTWVPEETHFGVGNNGQRVLLLGNKDEKNAWGLERMYRLMPGYHTVHNVRRSLGSVSGPDGLIGFLSLLSELPLPSIMPNGVKTMFMSLYARIRKSAH